MTVSADRKCLAGHLHQPNAREHVHGEENE
jgi:hypothetical protein